MTPPSTYKRSEPRWDVTCGFCDQGGTFHAQHAASMWKEDHFMETGHDDNFFEVERTETVEYAIRRTTQEVLRDYLNTKEKP